MRERADLAGCHLAVESGPSRGTTVTVTWPRTPDDGGDP
jgi:signal transduction histidine kinase